MASKKNIIISPSILAANLGCLRDEVKTIEAAGADWIHVDVMDGHFVPNITFGPSMVKAVRQVTPLPIDVHLMISPVDPYIDDFVKSGASILTVHPESGPHLNRTLQAIKHHGIKTGVALNPATPLEFIWPVLYLADLVLVMSVNPGFGGQGFIMHTLDRVKKLRDYINHHKLDTLIEIDGGITPDTANLAVKAGVDILVAGTAIFKEKNYHTAIARLRSA